MSHCVCTFRIFRKAVLVRTGVTQLACVCRAWANAHLSFG